MHKLIVSMHKELLLLLRDKAGLAVLFIMPAALVFVITLLQDPKLPAIKNTTHFSQSG